MSDKKIKARVIAQHADHEIDDVITLTETEAKSAAAEGWADAHPDAVKYAESLGKPAKAPAANDEGEAA